MAHRPHNKLVRYPFGLLFLTLLICLLILIKTFKSPIATPLDSHKTAPSFKSADERLVYHNNIGIALLEQFNHEEALKEFANCLAIKKDFLPGIVNSALAHFYLQQFDQSEKFLKHALQINEREPSTLFTLGMIYKNQDKLDLALESFKKVLLHNAEDPPTLYQLGQINLKKQEYDQAEYFLSKAVQLSPYDTAAHYSLAMSLLRKGEQTKGRAMIAKFMSLREKGGISSTGTQYGEQGEYMLAIGEYPYIKDLLPSQVISKEQKQIYFVDATKTTGIHFKHGAKINKTATKQIFPKLTSQWVHSMGSGAAFGDYDNDGDVDIFVVNNHEQAVLLRNEARSYNWLHVKLIGTLGNRDGIGSKIRLRSGSMNQLREIIAGSSYMSFNSLTAEFGLGSQMLVDWLEVRWLNGRIEQFTDIEVNQRIIIKEGEGIIQIGK